MAISTSRYGYPIASTRSGGTLFSNPKTGTTVKKNISPAVSSTKYQTYSTKTTTAPKTTNSGGGSNKPSGGSASDNVAQKAQQKLQDTSGAAQRAVDEANARARSAIADRASSLRSGLQGMKAGVAPWQQESEKFVTDQYGNLANTYQSGMNSANQIIDQKKAQVNQYAKGTIADMGSNMRNSLLAAQMKVGAMGGGNSSASEAMLPYAYAKESGRQYAGIKNQETEQLGNLDQEAITVRTTYDQGLKEIDNWKLGALNQVRQDAKSQLDQIDQAMLQATDDEKAALANISMNLLDNAQAMLNQIQAETRSRSQGLQDWATQRMAQLQDMQTSLSGQLKYSPQQMTYESLDVGNTMGGNGDAYVPYIPRTVKKKTEYNY